MRRPYPARLTPETIAKVCRVIQELERVPVGQRIPRDELLARAIAAAHCGAESVEDIKQAVLEKRLLV